MKKPRPLWFRHVTELLPITHVKGPDTTFVPGAKVGVPRPGFEPHATPVQIRIRPDGESRTFWVREDVEVMQ